MNKNQYEKYRNKYCKCDYKCFKVLIDKENTRQIYHKGVKFWNIAEADFKEFESWTEKEQMDYLNGAWNFYMAIND